MKRFTLITGLPGSGKSFLANKMKEEDPSILLIDDPMKPADLNWDIIRQAQHVVICDVNFCDFNIRAEAIRQIREQCGFECSIDWIFFENNAVNCRHNVLVRDDGRNVFATIERLEKIYYIPEMYKPKTIYMSSFGANFDI